MNGWRRVRFVDLCEVHVDCVNRTAPVVEEPTPYKMIRTTNVRGGFIDTENVRFVTAETYARWTRRLVPRRGDIVLTREAPLGGVGKVRTDDQIFLGQRLYHFRADPKLADPDFLLYALMGPDLQGQIRGFGSGSTVEHMRLPDIEKLEVDAPALAEQRRIASILSTYDDLIDNCERRIRALDAMARLLHREWFPTAVNDRRDAARRVPVTRLVEVNPRVSAPRGAEVSFVPMGSLSSETMVISDVERRTAGSGSKFMNGDTLFARITPCLENGKTGFVQFLGDGEAACGSTEFIILRGRTVPPEWVYCLARSAEFRDHAIKSMTGATGRQRVQEACFEQFLVPEPRGELVARFAEAARPMFQLAHVLHERATALRRTRDILLPRLLSGQLSVEDAA